ncbi:MAG: hypothetical protein GC190_21405 [Alphaproteobacteria bacterium]|nr:hypothetical protein [Alphaproteobacteria bacterium]
MADRLGFDRLKLLVRTMAANTKSAVSNGRGGGWPQRWWERLFALILVLIAVVAAILLYMIISRGYCDRRPLAEWWAGTPAEQFCPFPPGGGAGQLDPTLILGAWRQFNGYGDGIETFSIDGRASGANVHERYMWYQPYPGFGQENYFFLAFQPSGYGVDSTSSARDLYVEVRLRQPGPVYPTWINVTCDGPSPLPPAGNAPTTSSSPTWYWKCPIPNGQSGGYGQGGSWGAYRVFIINNSQQPFRYVYACGVATTRYPRGNYCPTPPDLNNPPSQPGSTPYSTSSSPYSPPYGGSGGYPSSTGGSGYPASGYPSGGSGYPSGGSGYPSSSGGSAYPSSSSGSARPSSSGSTYSASSSTPGTVSSSPPPPSAEGAAAQ